MVLLLALSALPGGCTGPPPTAGKASTPAAPATDVAETRTRIVVLGDSLAAGLGLAEDEAFPAVAQAMLRARGFEVEVVNAGVSGDTSAGGLSRVDWVLQQRPDVLVVELGGNDALRGQPVGNIESNLHQIVRRGRAAGAAVILLGMDLPANYGPDYAAAFADIYPRIAAEEGVTLVPAFVREIGADQTLLQPDGLHPTAEGQRRLAERLLPTLTGVLEDVEPEPEE